MRRKIKINVIELVIGSVKIILANEIAGIDERFFYNFLIENCFGKIEFWNELKTKTQFEYLTDS